MYLPLPDEPLLKKFKSKQNLPKLASYSEPAPDWYWEKWPCLDWEVAKKLKSQINPEILLEMGRTTKFPYPCLLKEIYNDVKKGVSLGVKKEFQIPSTATNAPSALEVGEKVSDELAFWIVKGFVLGPMKEEDIPFKTFKSSGLMAKIKPNGSIRPILNFSKGHPSSLNAGIDSKEFPTVMSSTEEWVRVLLRCGKRAKFCKNDWASRFSLII